MRNARKREGGERIRGRDNIRLSIPAKDHSFPPGKTVCATQFAPTPATLCGKVSEVPSLKGPTR